MRTLDGNALLVFIKWGEKKEPPVFQGFFVLFVYPHVVDTSGRTDDDGLGAAYKYCQAFTLHGRMKSTDNRHSGIS